MKNNIINIQIPIKDQGYIDVDKYLEKHLCSSEFLILRKSIDARRKNQIKIVLSVSVMQHGGEDLEKFEIKYKKKKNIKIPIIGSGPAGLFAALGLIENGYTPIIFERGSDLETRVKDVFSFWDGGLLKEASNIQFGAGGAGTFSDGKLTSRSKDKELKQKVLAYFVKFGALEKILYENKPHIGSDKLRQIVANIIKYIGEYGGEVHFLSKMTGLCLEANHDKFKLKGFKLENGSTFDCEKLILALGHSARDTFFALEDESVALEAKDFAIGLRVEHEQELINKNQYGDFYKHPNLPPAEYFMTFKKGNHSVYTFCMSPGGKVINASSEANHLVTNGMSFQKRNSAFANSAVLINIPKDLFFKNKATDGILFQRQIEKMAFELGDNCYMAPAQYVQDFLNNHPTKSIKPAYTFKPDLVPGTVKPLIPKELVSIFKKGLISFDKKLNGFSKQNALLIGPETRTSSTIRVLRNKENLESINVSGLFPIGEGAGYAGGIISSAIDGLKTGFLL
ncbi:MAG: FAD-dependent protein [Pseudomonadota bacterium]